MKVHVLLSTIISLACVSASAMDKGTYANAQGDILTVGANGKITLEQSRQVGGPGGISNDETVPYETTCRYVEAGTIVSESATSISYKDSSVHLTKRVKAYNDKKQLENDVNCLTYISIFDGKAKNEDIQFTYEKAGLVKQASK